MSLPKEINKTQRKKKRGKRVKDKYKIENNKMAIEGSSLSIIT